MVTKGLQGSSVDLTGKMEVLNIPQFVKYFKVCNDDNEFFENFVLKLSELASIATYVSGGVTFEPLLNELAQLDFFISLELTDKEPNAVMNAQMMMQILCKVNLIDIMQLNSKRFDDVNDMDEVPMDETIMLDEGVEQFGKHVYLETRRVADLATEEYYYT